jgi:hypothetical protein
MLVDNKFIYISLPRCASTTFVISLYRYNIPVQYYTDSVELYNSKIDKNISNEDLADELIHPHESIFNLESKFGYNRHEIISVKRDRHESYISLWRHVLDEIQRTGDTHSFEILQNLNEDDILYFTSEDVVATNEPTIIDSYGYNTTQVSKFIKKFNLNSDNQKLYMLLRFVFSYNSLFHNFDKRIIWFDFTKLDELERWVSNKLEMNFKLEKINSSKHIECNLKLNDNFIKKYNNIFDRFDLPKNNKTII